MKTNSPEAETFKKRPSLRLSNNKIQGNFHRTFTVEIPGSTQIIYNKLARAAELEKTDFNVTSERSIN